MPEHHPRRRRAPRRARTHPARRRGARPPRTELQKILESVATVSQALEGRGRRRADEPPDADTQRLPRGRRATQRSPRRRRWRAPASGGPALPRPQDPRGGVTVADLTALTAASSPTRSPRAGPARPRRPGRSSTASRRSTATLHAFLHVDRAGALAAAHDVDRTRAGGEQLSPLAGVPIAVKDLLCTVGQPTTCGSRILEGWVPPYDATVVTRLRRGRHADPRQDQPRRVRDGLVDRALGVRPDSRNPWDTDRTPGGSGGGSAAAVAARLAPLAIGTDTGGSIRQPGALTGTVGVKPTYGGVSPLRHRGDGQQPRPGGPGHPDGARRRAAARGHRRPRPDGLHLDRRAGAAGGRGRPSRRRLRAADRRGEGARRRGLPEPASRRASRSPWSCSSVPAPRSSRCRARASRRRSRRTTS